MLRYGVSDADAARQLSGYSHVRVLRLPHARGLLCGVEAAVNAQFAALSRELLTPPEWCSTCFGPCASELSTWLDAPTIAAGATGSHRWCARWNSPAALPSAAVGCTSTNAH